MKNKLRSIIILITVFVILFSGCDLLKEDIFEEIEIGENFGNNIDGHQKKLPHNYCLSVIIGTYTKLFKVPDDLLNKPYFSNSVYNTPAILEGRYIKGYFDNDNLVLCEEYENHKLSYLSFEFATEEIHYYDTLDEIYELFSVASIDWFPLCNTIDERID